MRCETCLGSGRVLRRSYPSNELFPCPCEVCGGTGFDHCCSGDCAVNDPALRVEREHVSSADCWCKPEEDEPGVWIHREVQ